MSRTLRPGSDEQLDSAWPAILSMKTVITCAQGPRCARKDRACRAALFALLLPAVASGAPVLN